MAICLIVRFGCFGLPANQMSDAEFDERVEKSDFGLGPAERASRKSCGPGKSLSMRADTSEASCGYSQPRALFIPSLAESADVE